MFIQARLVHTNSNKIIQKKKTLIALHNKYRHTDIYKMIAD